VPQASKVCPEAVPYLGTRQIGVQRPADTHDQTPPDQYCPEKNVLKIISRSCLKKLGFLLLVSWPPLSNKGFLCRPNRVPLEVVVMGTKATRFEGLPLVDLSICTLWAKI